MEREFVSVLRRSTIGLVGTFGGGGGLLRVGMEIMMVFDFGMADQSIAHLHLRAFELMICLDFEDASFECGRNLPMTCYDVHSLSRHYTCLILRTGHSNFALSSRKSRVDWKGGRQEDRVAKEHAEPC
jgi:hypothetical protein